MQLVSLREVASSHGRASIDAGETTRTVTRYLRRAFGFDDVFLLLVEPRGRPCSRAPGRTRAATASTSVDLRAAADSATTGALARACGSIARWCITPRTRHPLADAARTATRCRRARPDSGSTVCVPLQRSHALVPPARAARAVRRALHARRHRACSRRRPGPHAERWAVEREERQRHCLGCELMPMLGVLGIARAPGTPALAQRRRRRCSSRSRSRSRRCSRTRASTRTCARASASASTCSTAWRARSRR